MVMGELDLSFIPATLYPITHVGIIEEVYLGLSITSTIPFLIMEKVLVEMVEVDIGILPDTLPPMNQMVMR